MAKRQMRKLTVSVVIPNYNYGRFLAEAIESVLQQDYACKEIIVVDDGSTDNSLELLTGYEGKVQVIRQINSGVGAARNTGVKYSTGDIIAFLDADDYWAPDKIKQQVESFEGDGEVGLVSCGMREFDSERKTIQYFVESIKGKIASQILEFREKIIVSGSAITVRRDIFELAGGFDERKELHPSEDWEFCYRVSRISKMDFIPRALVHYRNHGNNAHLKIHNMEKAMVLAYQKIYENPPPEILALRRKSYGNLYSVLAACYYYAGDRKKFIKNAFKSMWYQPKKIAYFIGFPFRLLRRQVIRDERNKMH